MNILEPSKRVYCGIQLPLISHLPSSPFLSFWLVQNPSDLFGIKERFPTSGNDIWLSMTPNKLNIYAAFGFPFSEADAKTSAALKVPSIA